MAAGLAVQWCLVGLVVLGCAVWLLQKLTPLSLKIALANKLNGKVPDRIRIWLVGQVGCGNCAPNRHNQ